MIYWQQIKIQPQITITRTKKNGNILEKVNGDKQKIIEKTLEYWKKNILKTKNLAELSKYELRKLFGISVSIKNKKKYRVNNGRLCSIEIVTHASRTNYYKPSFKQQTQKYKQTKIFKEKLVSKN